MIACFSIEFRLGGGGEGTPEAIRFRPHSRALAGNELLAFIANIHVCGRESNSDSL